MEEQKDSSTSSPGLVTPFKSLQIGEEGGGAGLLPIIASEHIVPGELLGGRALREWRRAVVHGTDVIVSRQRSDDNPPAATRRANLQAYALLRHPHIVTLLAATTHGEVITEVCDYDLLPAPGPSSGSAKEERRRSISLLRMLAYARDIAQALAWAHSMHVIHRDVKPSHWLVVGNRAKLGGWMFAEVQRGDMHPKPDDHFHGTPLYMAPELWRPEPFDGRKADVYSFGLAMWEVIHNDFAFSGFDDLLAFREAVTDRMERPLLSDDTMPIAVNWLIARCWAQSPAQRPTMLEVVASLTRIITALELLAGTTSVQ